MKTENKELLLKDLCARLPYGVKIKTSYNKMDEPIELRFVNHRNESFAIGSNFTLISGLDFDTYECKPYLFPLSSMTEEQREEFVKFAYYESRLEDCGGHKELYYYDLVGHENNLYPNSDAIDWLDKNHFDYRGLIEKGLAIDATGLNIY